MSSNATTIKHSNTYSKWVKWLVFLFAILLYANTIPNDYNLDDNLVTINHRLTSKGISAIPEIFTSYYYEDDKDYKYEYRPIVLVTFAIEHSFFGENAHISHLLNVLFYGILCMVIFLTLQRLFLNYNYLLPLFITLLFTVHPIHTEVVASIKNRDEILTLLFGMLSIWSILKLTDTIGIKNQLLWFIATTLLFTLALLTKRSIIPFALIIPVTIILFRQPSYSLVFLATLPLAIAATFFAPLSFFYQKIAFAVTLLLAPLFLNMYLHKEYNRFRRPLKKVPGKIYGLTQFATKSISSIAKKSATLTFSVTKYLFIELIRPFAIIINRGKDVFQDNTSPIFTSGKMPLGYQVLVYIITAVFLLLASYGYRLAGIAGIAYLIAVFLLAPSSLRHQIFLIVVAYLLAIFKLYQFESGNYTVMITAFAFMLFSENRKKVAKSIIAKIILLCILANSIYTGFYNGWFGIPFLLGSLLPFYFFIRLKFWRGAALPILLGTATLIVTISAGEINKVYHWLHFFLILPTYWLVISGNTDTFSNQTIHKFWQATKGHLHHSFFTFQFLIVITIFTIDPSNSAIRVALQPYSPEVVIDKLSQPAPYEEPTPPLLPILLQQKAPQLVPKAGRKLEYTENPLSYIDDASIRIGTSMYTLGKYVQLMIFPHSLSYYYGYDHVPMIKIKHPLAIGSIAVHFILLLIAILSIYRRPLITYAIFFYLVSILPFSNLAVDVAGIIGERFVFVASLGFCILLGFLILRVFKVDLSLNAPVSLRSVPKTFLGVVSIILLLLVVKTFSRNFQWKDHSTLFHHDIEHLDNSAQAHNILGTYLMSEISNGEVAGAAAQSNMLESIVHFSNAVKIYPNFFNAHFNLAITYLTMGNYQDAIVHLKRTVEIDTLFSAGYEQLGALYYAENMYEEAIPYLIKTIELTPDNIGAYNQLSHIYYQFQEYNLSIEVNLLAIENNPQAYDPYMNLAQTYIKSDNKEEALYYFEKAYQINSNDPNLYDRIMTIRDELGK